MQLENNGLVTWPQKSVKITLPRGPGLASSHKVISQVRFHLCSTIYEHFPVFSWKLFCCVSSIKCVITNMPWIILFKTQASFPLQKLFTEERNVDEDLSVTSSVQVVTGETPDVCLITLCSFRVASCTCIVRRWTWQKV